MSGGLAVCLPANPRLSEPLGDGARLIERGGQAMVGCREYIEQGTVLFDLLCRLLGVTEQQRAEVLQSAVHFLRDYQVCESEFVGSLGWRRGFCGPVFVFGVCTNHSGAIMRGLKRRFQAVVGA